LYSFYLISHSSSNYTWDK